MNLHLQLGARGGVVVKALRYKPACHGFDSILPGDVLRVGPTGGERRKGFYLH